MRRREKFVIVALVLSFSLMVIQYINLEWRYLAIALLMVFSYFASAFALADDLNFHEWFTILPLPALFSGSVALFYFLLPSSFVSKIFIILTFAIGIYALYLTANIYSVAKGRTIQLIYAAHTIGLFITLLTSLFFTNSLLSMRLVYYLNPILLGLIHFPLVLISLWAINLEQGISKEVLRYTVLITLLIIELVFILMFLPLPIWHISLFLMAFLYIVLGVFHSVLRGRFFQNTINEFILVTVVIILIFILLFPGK